jgi:hypothetical protein
VPEAKGTVVRGRVVCGSGRGEGHTGLLPNSSVHKPLEGSGAAIPAAAVPRSLSLSDTWRATLMLGRVPPVTPPG